MIRRLLFLIALLLPLPTAAQDLEGSWAFKIDETAIFRFHLEENEDGWSGVWERPASFQSNGVIFKAMTGPAVESPSAQGRVVGEWTELTFEDPRPGAVADVFLFRSLGDGTAEAIYSATGFAPFALQRVLAAEVSGPWDPAATYQRAGLDLAAAGLPVQFTTGARAVARGPQIAPDDILDAPEPPLEAAGTVQTMPQPVTDRQPVMIGR